MRIVKKIFISIIVIFVLIITAGFVFAYFFEDEVNELFVRQVDKHLETKIDVKKINFSVLNNFPNASVEFTEVVAFSPQGINKKSFKNRRSDTLFTAKTFIFEFNIVDIINALTEKGIKIDKSIIKLEKHFKEIGDYEITIVFTPDITANLKINISKE